MKPVMERTSVSIPLWLVWLAAAAFVLAGLGSAGILDNNEGLYSEIPREMLASHDWRHWIIPHLNGLPYMEKPPLLYWLTALSFALFGESEWSARAVPALSSLACMTMLLRFGHAVKRPQVGRLAALMFVSGAGVAAMSRVLMFDMLLTALLTGALMCAYLYVTQGRKRFLRYSYALLALALLAKGFVALVLFGMVVVLYTLVMQPSLPGFLRGCGKWFEPGALLVFFAIAVPWHLVASLTEPIFAWFYFINEHVLRFLGKREPYDYYGGAWWYYLPRMAIYLFPWSFLLLWLFAPFRRDVHLETVALRRFLFLAWLMPLAFFSISTAKANYYLIAVMPFAAFHLAIALDNRSVSAGWLRALPGVLIGLLAMFAGVAMLMRKAQPNAGLSILGLAQDQFLLGVVGGLLVLAVIGAALAWRKPETGVLAYLGLSVWTGTALWLVLVAMEPLASTRLVARYLQSDHAGKAVYLYRVFEQKSSLPFYLKQPVPVIDAHSNDLFWGNKLRKNDIIISADQFDVIVQQPRPVAVVVMDRHLKDFRALNFFDRFTSEKHIGETTVFTN